MLVRGNTVHTGYGLLYVEVSPTGLGATPNGYYLAYHMCLKQFKSLFGDFAALNHHLYSCGEKRLKTTLNKKIEILDP